jgi:hypothetical protein
LALPLGFRQLAVALPGGGVVERSSTFQKEHGNFNPECERLHMSKTSKTTQENKPPAWAEPLFKQSATDALNLYNSGVGGNT